jgi:hypothetical protein
MAVFGRPVPHEFRLSYAAQCAAVLERLKTATRVYRLCQTKSGAAAIFGQIYASFSQGAPSTGC